MEFGPGMSKVTGHHPGGEHHVDDSVPDDPANRASTAGTAPTSTPAGSSASTQAPALPVAGREG
jgi:hypothetical protein